MNEPSREIEPDRLAVMVEELLGAQPPDDASVLRAAIDGVLASTPSKEVDHFLARIETTGQTWGYHPPDPLARRLSRAILRALLSPGSRLHDAVHLEGIDGPCVLLGNHLGFADANLIEHLITEAGDTELPERITTLVGPKVFVQPLRRFASLCFGALKLPQSATRASEEAVMPPREVARLASDAIRTARERLDAGDHLLIFIEGTRSRTGQMQSALAGVARYLSTPGIQVLPIGIWGSEEFATLGDDGIHRAVVQARVGPPVPAEELLSLCNRKRPLVMDVVGFLVAGLLPVGYRGLYGENPSKTLAVAQRIAAKIRSGDPG